nr:PTS transporter subunit EIIC [Spiroplasma clarkii]
MSDKVLKTEGQKKVKAEGVKNNGWVTFRNSMSGIFSKLSKAFLLPIALLPIAGVFLGVGATIAANTDQGSFGWYLGSVMNQMGDVCFGNLPILFAISVAIAYTEDSGVAAITAVVGFLVLNGIQRGLITTDDSVTYKLLWWNSIPAASITQNVGITSLNTGVFAAIFVGAISAIVYNRFHKTQLPAFISFFSGSKLVPIVVFVAVIPLAFIFMFVWPGIAIGLQWFGVNSGKLPGGVDSWIFEIIERSLIPFGLHHVFYAPLWWSEAGGSISDTFLDTYLNKIAESGVINLEKLKADFSPSFFAALGLSDTGTAQLSVVRKAFYDTFDSSNLWGTMGDQTIMFAVLAQKQLNLLILPKWV